MIIPNRYNETESSQEFETTEFKIEVSAEAFRAISDRLYTNKPMAIVREIVCNAIDIHTSEKVDIQYEVHLPTYEEPFFSVKDFGTGLSEEDIRGLYSTAFKSSKRNSNETVGCLGVGKLSPLSNGDSFTVMSRYNGIVYTYNVFISGKGIPSVAKISEEPTTEPNGLEVSCAVALGDINRFAEAARKFFARIPNLPKFNIEFAPDKIVYSAEGEGWKARSTNYGEQSGLVAVVGPVAYPFSLPSGSVSSELHYLLSANLDLFFAIGEVDVAMSRESLSLDENTIEKIVSRLRSIHEQSIAKLEEELDKCPNIFRARKRIHEVSKQYGSLYYGAKAADISYKGELLKTLGTSVITKTVIAGMENNSGATLISTVYRRGRDVVNTEEISSLQADKEYKFFVAAKLPNRSRLKQYFEENSGAIVFFRSEKPAAEVLQNFGLAGEKVLTSDDFPKAERGKRMLTDKGSAPYLTLNKNGYHYYSDSLSSDNWSLPEEELDEDDEVVYVKMTRYGIGEDAEKTYGVANKLSLMKLCGGPDIDVYGLRSKTYNEAVKNANWISFDAWFKREFEKMKKKAVAAAQKYSMIEGSAERADVLALLPSTHEVKKFAKEKDALKNFNTLCSRAGVSIAEMKDQKYPLLKYINYNAAPEAVVEYIMDRDAKMLAESSN